ncbi:helix-turn-helix domain-containing protein [Kribbella lupini]|uniref:Helix-turn-helix domain-containing protein n=1 Tax=Kribbella lupini TaxID=291602 RepID=A0ABP4MCL0_9ACTN
MEITSREAAHTLGIGQRRVRRLAADGTLRGHRFGGVWHVDRDDVTRRQAATPTRGRPWSERISWGALWLLSGLTPDWLGDSEKSRLRKRLRETTPESLALAVRRRAHVEHCRILPAYLETVTKEQGVAAAGLSAAESAGADILSMDLAELYCDRRTREQLFTRYALTTTSSSPNLTVRTIEDPALVQALLASGTTMPDAVVAVDLIESTDPRTTHAGTELAAHLLADFRRA